MKVTWKNCFRICASVFILFLCINYWSAVERLFSVLLSASAPIIIGFVIAYVLNILMSFYEKHYFPKCSSKKFVVKSRRPVCLVAAFITLCGIVALIVWLVIPELFSCVKFLLAEIPPAIGKLIQSDWVRENLPKDLWASLASVDWMSYITKLINYLASGIGGAVSAVVNIVSSLFSALVTLFISIIFSIYLLSGKNTLKSHFKRTIKSYVPSKWFDKAKHCYDVLDDSFHRYIVGQCTEAVVLGVLCFLGMLLFRFPYAGMIGALIGFTALIPVAGAYIGAIVGAIMILTVSPLKALLFLVFIVVLQQLEGNLIYPKVVGNSIGLPAMWVLAAVTLGGGVAGILGMLLGVPLAAAAYRLLRENVAKRELLAAKSLEANAEESVSDKKSDTSS